MKYKYVVFNNIDNSIWHPDPDGYYAICLEDLQKMEDVRVVGVPLQNQCFLLKLLHRIHVYGFFSRFLKFIPRSIWYPLYFDSSSFEKNEKICFVIIANLSAEYLQYLKAHYPNAVFVKFFRDLVWTKQQWYDAYKKVDVIDYWVTYDEEEALKYNMHYYHEIESKVELDTDFEIRHDVFFAGRAKNRLNRLVSVYDKLEAQRVKCFFYITGVDVKEQIPREGIVYSNKLLSYREMLLLNTHSRCILEINQENAVGYTSRFLEAVMYNRKLLTDNLNITNSDFYDSRYIQCFKDVDDIDASFIVDNNEVDFHYNNEFSPRGFIEYLDSLI